MLETITRRVDFLNGRLDSIGFDEMIRLHVEIHHNYVYVIMFMGKVMWDSENEPEFNWYNLGTDVETLVGKELNLSLALVSISYVEMLEAQGRIDFLSELSTFHKYFLHEGCVYEVSDPIQVGSNTRYNYEEADSDSIPTFTIDKATLNDDW